MSADASGRANTRYGLSDLSPLPTYQIEIMHGASHRQDRRQVVSDLLAQAPLACVHDDPRHNGPLATMLACLQHFQVHTYPDRPQWLVIIQDDAVPEPLWLTHLPRVLKASPEPVLGLTYCGFQYRAPKTDADFTVGRYTLQGGAFAVHSSMIEAGLVPWLRLLWERDRLFNDDTALAAFSRWTGHQTACVTHALFTQPLPSSLRGHQKTNPAPTRTIRQLPASPNYQRTSIEQLVYVPVDERLGLLLQHRYPELSAITATRLNKSEVWP